TEFGVSDQRSTHDLECAELFGCRELLPTDEVRERAERLVGAEPWGREQWERLSQGLTFDGMESWLPWLTEGEHLLPDLIGEAATAWDPVVGDGAHLVHQMRDFMAQRYRVVVCADGAGTAARMERSFRDEGLVGVDMVIQPLERGFILPSIKLAVLAESDVTG